MIPRLNFKQKINIVGISVIFILITVMTFIYAAVIKEHKISMSMIGKTIVIGKDILTVTNYNDGNETYDLSNRIIVDRDYVILNVKQTH